MGRKFYLGSSYTGCLNYGSLFSQNEEIRSRGVREDPKDMKEKWNMDEAPRVLWNPLPENFDIVEDMVASRLGRRDAMKSVPSAVPRFFERPTKARVERRITKILRRFADASCPETLTMKKTDRVYHAKEIVILTLSSGLSRDEMAKYVETKLMIYW